MKNRDLLREAIADAKTVKETAIANAQNALTEAFTPFLKEKLAAKLAEMENEETNESTEEVTEVEENEVTENESNENLTTESEDENTDDLDLEALLKELEGEEEIDEYKNEHPLSDEDALTDKKEDIKEGEENEEAEEIDLENMSEDDLKLFIEDVISGMVEAGELEAGEGETEEEEIENELGTDDTNGEPEGSEEEDVDLNELLAEIKKNKTPMKENLELKKVKLELKEAYSAIKKIKDDLNDINLLNAKLLYTNKIFRNKTLSENQKVKVLSAFDKTTSKKEAQLVYETIMEGLKTKITKPNITESMVGAASKPTGIVAKKPILEEKNQFDRWQKLAGINKK